MKTAAKPAKEKLSKGKVLAGLVSSLRAARDDRKAAMAQFKKEEEDIQRQINKLAHDIETGQNDLFDIQIEEPKK
jgi:cell division protein FtsB